MKASHITKHLRSVSDLFGMETYSMNKLLEFPFETGLAALNLNSACAASAKYLPDGWFQITRWQPQSCGSLKSSPPDPLELVQRLIYSDVIKGRPPFRGIFAGIPFCIFISSHSSSISVKLKNHQSWSVEILEVQLHQQSVRQKWETFIRRLRPPSS